MECFQLFFAANSVPEDKQVATFLSLVGSATNSILRDLRIRSNSPNSETVSKHYEPKRPVIIERYHFHKRIKSQGRPLLHDFDAALRKLATHCGFADHLKEALHDRFVCGGLHDKAFQRQLLAGKELTHAKAVELALSMEAAEKNIRSFKGSD